MEFLPTNRNNARVLKKIKNRNVTPSSIKLGDTCNVNHNKCECVVHRERSPMASGHRKCWQRTVF